MNATEIPRVFEMFSQLEGSVEQQQGGLGIGLHLAKRLVEAHGGSIQAHSEGPGFGSEFVVALPLAAPLVQAVERAKPVELMQKRRFLVVEDNRDAALSMEMLLHRYGHIAYVAHDGIEAMKKASALRPDVVLLDLGLPRMDGYEVCRAIRAQSWGHDVLIIALSGWAQEEDRLKSARAGFDFHLAKPIDYLKLVALVDSSESGETLTQ
jgi:CheY-like chemotaxis protein